MFSDLFSCVVDFYLSLQLLMFQVETCSMCSCSLVITFLSGTLGYIVKEIKREEFDVQSQ